MQFLKFKIVTKTITTGAVYLLRFLVDFRFPIQFLLIPTHLCIRNLLKLSTFRRGFVIFFGI